MTKKKDSPMGEAEAPEIVAPAPKGEEESQALVHHVHDAELYLAMEKRDEDQIVANLQGRYQDEFVYRFEKGGRVITGLSWIGIQEASREYGGIRCPIDRVQIEETDTHWVVMVEAEDVKTGSVRLGRAKQPKKMKWGSKFVVDEFADRKALSKAQRNAIQPLLPQTLLKEWIDGHRAPTEKLAPSVVVSEPPPLEPIEEPPPVEEPPPSEEPPPEPIEETQPEEPTPIGKKVRDWADFLFPGEKDKKKQNRLIVAMGTVIDEAGAMTFRPDLRSISDEQLEEIYTKAQNVTTKGAAEKVLALGSYQAWFSEQDDIPF